MTHKDYESTGFACLVGKIPKTPKLSPMADNAITQGDIEGLGSLVYICGMMAKVKLVVRGEKSTYF